MSCCYATDSLGSSYQCHGSTS